MPRLTDEQKEMYQQFCDEFTFCWSCGWSGGFRGWHISKLDCSHIVGAGGRRADRRAIVRECSGCHRLSHGDRIVIGSTPLPNLTLKNHLWLKRRFDFAFYDPKYLQSLRVQRAEVLFPEPLPEWFNIQREKSPAYRQWLASR